MKKQQRFYISKDGHALTDRTKAITTTIEKVRVVRSGRIETVIFNEDVAGAIEQKIARYCIDEKDFSLGEAAPEAIAHRRKQASRHADPPPAVVHSDGKLIAFSKEELLELHESHLNAANLTLRKLAAHIKANG